MTWQANGGHWMSDPEHTRPTAAQLVRTWAAIERHARLVFDHIGHEERAMIAYYLRRGEPFTVVMT